jgi:hypothetical protein
LALYPVFDFEDVKSINSSEGTGSLLCFFTQEKPKIKTKNIIRIKRINTKSIHKFTKLLALYQTP